MSKERELLQRIVDYADAYLEIDMEFIPAIKELLIQPAVGAPHPESLRDHFAGLAMQGLIAGGKGEKWWVEKDFAWNAYRQADAMLAERGKSDD